MLRRGDTMRLPMFDPVPLHAASVSKRFGNRDALCGVDLTVCSGSVHGLLGPNGAGKTTLMRVLLGLVRRDAGHVQIFGTDMEAKAGPVPEGVSGFVETPAFYPYLSGRRNLALLARLDGKGRADGLAAVDLVLEEVGLGAHADAAVSTYSAGMRQRLGLAAAILRAPRLLFLDEPTSSLDPAGALNVRALVRRLAREGTAVVWSSHDMEEVEELCDTLTVIQSGRVLFTGDLSELRRLAPVAVYASLQTSDNHAAARLSAEQPGILMSRASDGGLNLSGDLEALDDFMVALGRLGVAVRSLERRTRSLEALFLQLTGEPGGTDGQSSGTKREANPVALRAVK